MARNNYITDLEKALNDVESSFVTFETFSGLNKNENIKDNPFFKDILEDYDNYILQFLESQKKLKENSLERNFCSQLFFTWQTIIKRNNNSLYNCLKLNGEVNKTNLTLALKGYEKNKNSELFKKIKEKKLIEKTYFVPDLVLHGGQDSIENQTLIVEVKFGDKLKNGNFENDFYKLAVYQKIYQFKDCVFIIVKSTLKEILEYLNGVDTSLIDKRSFWIMLKSEQKVCTFNLNDLDTKYYH